MIETARHWLRYPLTWSYRLAHRGWEVSRQNTIAVFAQPRSGSTWFTNLLLSLPGAAKIDGPLYMGPYIPDGRMPDGRVSKVKVLNRLGFYYQQPIPEDADFPEAKAFFHQLFHHQFITPYLFEETSLWQLPAAKTFIFKLYHAHQMIPWLLRHFSVTPVVLLRNPYAVVASQLDYPSFREVIGTGRYVVPDFRYSDFYRQYDAQLKTIRQPEEILAARWCMNYLPVVNDSRNNQLWCTVTYEGLLLRKERELARLFDFLGQGQPDSLERIYRHASQSTQKKTEQFGRPQQHLQEWKTRLSQQQQANIRRVLADFGVRGYGQELEPDYEVVCPKPAGS